MRYLILPLVLVFAACSQTLANPPGSNLSSAVQQPPVSQSVIGPAATSTASQTPDIGMLEDVVQKVPAEPPERPVITSQPGQSNDTSLARFWKSQPLSTSDLLLLSGNQLYRWDSSELSVSVLAENVADLAFASPWINAGNQSVLLLKSRNITVNGVERFDLQLLDVQNGDLTTILSETPRLHHLTISPDGERLAYMDQAGGGDISLLDLSGKQTDGDNPIVGKCLPPAAGTCAPPVWSPNSLSLFWTDGNGAWLASPGSSLARNILTTQLNIRDPKGQESQIPVQYSDPSWSPTGRYVLVSVSPQASPVRWQAVLDTLTGRLAQVPGSYQQSNLESATVWLPDGDLILAHAGGPPAHSTPYVQRFRVLPTRDELLVGLQTMPLAIPSTDSLATLIQCPAWLIAPLSSRETAEEEGGALEPADELFFGLIANSAGANPVLYRLRFTRAGYERLREIPFEVDQLSWSPDGRAALAFGKQGQVVFLSTSSLAFVNLSEFMPTYPQRFGWLQPNLQGQFSSQQDSPLPAP